MCWKQLALCLLATELFDIETKLLPRHMCSVVSCILGSAYRTSPFTFFVNKGRAHYDSSSGTKAIREIFLPIKTFLCSLRTYCPSWIRAMPYWRLGDPQ